jgi:hypothetical protein
MKIKRVITIRPLRCFNHQTDFKDEEYLLEHIQGLIHIKHRISNKISMTPLSNVDEIILDELYVEEKPLIKHKK